MNPPLPAVEIREIPFNFNQAYVDLLCLRQAVLRTPLGLTYTMDTLLAEADQAHVGLYTVGNSHAVGCCLIKKTADGWFQMRQVAVHPTWQGSGLGTKLIQYFETYLLAQGGKRALIEGRAEIARFYLSKGYAQVGEAYLHPDTGMEHVRLEKHWA